MSSKEFVDLPGTPEDTNKPQGLSLLPDLMKQQFRHNMHVGRLMLNDVQDTYNLYRCMSSYLPTATPLSIPSMLPEMSLFEKPAPLADPVEDQIANAEAFVGGLFFAPGPNYAKGLKVAGEAALAACGASKTAAAAKALPAVEIVSSHTPEAVKRVAEKAPDLVLGWRDQIGSTISERLPKP